MEALRDVIVALNKGTWSNLYAAISRKFIHIDILYPGYNLFRTIGYGDKKYKKQLQKLVSNINYGVDPYRGHRTEVRQVQSWKYISPMQKHNIIRLHILHPEMEILDEFVADEIITNICCEFQKEVDKNYKLRSEVPQTSKAKYVHYISSESDNTTPIQPNEPTVRNIQVNVTSTITNSVKPPKKRPLIFVPEQPKRPRIEKEYTSKESVNVQIRPSELRNTSVNNTNESLNANTSVNPNISINNANTSVNANANANTSVINMNTQFVSYNGQTGDFTTIVEEPPKTDKQKDEEIAYLKEKLNEYSDLVNIIGIPIEYVKNLDPETRVVMRLGTVMDLWKYLSVFYGN